MPQHSKEIDLKTQIMVEAASEYLSVELNGDQESFESSLTVFCEGRANQGAGRMVVAAGLIKAGFQITTKPNFEVIAPPIRPSEAIGDDLVRNNWYRYEGAIIELGMCAVNKERYPETYDKEIVDFVTREIK